MKFVVEGEMALPGGSRKFHKEIDAQNENGAKENTYKILGSIYGLKRSKIRIDTVKNSEAK